MAKVVARFIGLDSYGALAANSYDYGADKADRLCGPRPKADWRPDAENPVSDSYREQYPSHCDPNYFPGIAGSVAPPINSFYIDPSDIGDNVSKITLGRGSSEIPNYWPKGNPPAWLEWPDSTTERYSVTYHGDFGTGKPKNVAITQIDWKPVSAELKKYPFMSDDELKALNKNFGDNFNDVFRSGLPYLTISGIDTITMSDIDKASAAPSNTKIDSESEDPGYIQLVNANADNDTFGIKRLKLTKKILSGDDTLISFKDHPQPKPGKSEEYNPDSGKPWGGYADSEDDDNDPTFSYYGVLKGFAGDDTIKAKGANNLAYGDQGDDTLNGNDEFYDRLYGGPGKDLIIGKNSDWLMGGSGADDYRYKFRTGYFPPAFENSAPVRKTVGMGLIEYDMGKDSLSLHLNSLKRQWKEYNDELGDDKILNKFKKEYITVEPYLGKFGAEPGMNSLTAEHAVISLYYGTTDDGFERSEKSIMLLDLKPKGLANAKDEEDGDLMWDKFEEKVLSSIDFF